MHDVTVYVGEAEVAALELVGQLFVIETELVEDGCLDIVDVRAVGGHRSPFFSGPGAQRKPDRLPDSDHFRNWCMDLAWRE